MSSDDDDSVGTGGSVPREGGGTWTPSGGLNSTSTTVGVGDNTLGVADGGSVHSVPFPSAFGELSMSDTSQLTDGVGTG